MARIRSIKPEFWRDGRIARLTPACTLFFIGLWNFCDDEGKARADAYELSLNLPSFRSQDIVKYLRRLCEVGLIQSSVNRDWIVVANWQHQKIDKPRQPTVSKSEIEWLPVTREDVSPNTLRTVGDESDNVRRKDRIGKDRIGKDGISSPGVQAPAVVDPKSESPTKATWEAYSDAYLTRHKTTPIRNAATNGKLAQFVKRVGQLDAPAVAEFYVHHNDAFYVRKMHPVGLLLQDAESLHTQWVTGLRMTGARARDQERLQHNADVFAEAAARIEAREASK